MNQETLTALTALANKLGTTAEYLWCVLLKQAPITGAIDLTILVTLGIATFLVGKFLYKKTSRPKPTRDSPYPQAEWTEGDAAIPWAVFLVLALFVVIFIATNLTLAISALINPDYWALKQILK